MPTHVEYSYVVEKHDSSNCVWVDRSAKETSDPNVASSWLIDYS
jgi:hypothetical protein